MITPAKTATYHHIPHESFFITNSKLGRASFLVGSLSTCDKKLSPTDFKNFQDFLITVVWLILIEIFHKNKG